MKHIELLTVELQSSYGTQLYNKMIKLLEQETKKDFLILSQKNGRAKVLKEVRQETKMKKQELYTYELDAVLLVEIIGKKAETLYKEANGYLKSLENNPNKAQIRDILYYGIEKILRNDIKQYII